MFLVATKIDFAKKVQCGTYRTSAVGILSFLDDKTKMGLTKHNGETIPLYTNILFVQELFRPPILARKAGRGDLQ